MGNKQINVPILPVGISGFICWSGFSYYFLLSKCPNCGQRFHRGFAFVALVHVYLRKQCVHCGVLLSAQWKPTEIQRDIVRKWWTEGGSRRQGAIPDVGLKCPFCTYSLTGLTTETCPECGRTLEIGTYVWDVVNV